MQEDDEGFLYPCVDQSMCIHCGLCEKVCPVIHQALPGEPINTFAAKNMNDSIRRKSSSGGVFHALACNVINEGGVVFGARFDSKWGVEHSYTETISGLAFFQGSKYVQSNIGTAYTDAERFLKAGRKVLFSGTPCQLAGLRLFLRKDYGNLLLSVDVACHGCQARLCGKHTWQDCLTK
jgi:Coenzyme F420-reducing hydrogenase, beta subunit